MKRLAGWVIAATLISVTFFVYVKLKTAGAEVAAERFLAAVQRDDIEGAWNELYYQTRKSITSKELRDYLQRQQIDWSTADWSPSRSSGPPARLDCDFKTLADEQCTVEFVVMPCQTEWKLMAIIRGTENPRDNLVPR